MLPVLHAAKVVSAPVVLLLPLLLLPLLLLLLILLHLVLMLFLLCVCVCVCVIMCLYVLAPEHSPIKQPEKNSNRSGPERARQSGDHMIEQRFFHSLPKLHPCARKQLAETWRET